MKQRDAQLRLELGRNHPYQNDHVNNETVVATLAPPHATIQDVQREHAEGVVRKQEIIFRRAPTILEKIQCLATLRIEAASAVNQKDNHRLLLCNVFKKLRDSIVDTLYNLAVNDISGYMQERYGLPDSKKHERAKEIIQHCRFHSQQRKPYLEFSMHP